MNKIVKELTKQLEDKMYKFLEDNGYELERNNVNQIEKLKNELEKQDKTLRVASAIIPNENVIHFLIFFDSLSMPLGKEFVEELIIKDYFKTKEIKNE